MKKLLVKRLHPEATLPQRMTAGAAGMDLASVDRLTIPPGEHGTVSTGLAVALPNGWEGQVRPRSGLAARKGLTVLNTPGTVDADYRGEVRVILQNHGQNAVIIRPGDRIAQLVVVPVPPVQVEEVDELPDTDRGDAGFGSTGERASA